MYGQGNSNSQIGQSPQMPVRPLYHHQLPGPPPRPPNFQQGPPGPPPSVIQRGPPMYQHGPPPPSPAVHQAPPGAMPNSSHPYPHMHPTVPGSTNPLPHIYPTDQRNTQLHSPLGTHHVHQMLPSLPPPPPPPPRVLPLPPPPSTLYRAPPPPTSRFSTSSPFGSFLQPTSGSSLMPAMAPLPPPPPPSSPPPITPAPPSATCPLLSSAHDRAASSVTSSSQLSSDTDINHNEVRDNAPPNDGYIDHTAVSKGSVVLDLPAPPPKPSKEDVVLRIVDLCQHISKNGPGYEDLARQNEYGNSGYRFLYGGNPGSEDAIAHEYFLWMKKKCISDCKLDEVKNDLSSGVEATTHPRSAVVTTGSYSPADSDMEMEDDITECDIGVGRTHCVEGTSGYELIHNDLDTKEQLHEEKNSAGGYKLKKISCENALFSCSPALAEMGEKGLSDRDQLAFESSVSRVSPVTATTDKLQTVTHFKESETPLATDKLHFGISAAAEGTDCERNFSQLIKGGSPIRLLQDYASDDSSEKSNKPCLKSVTSFGATSSSENTSCHLKTDMESKNTNGNFSMPVALNTSSEALDALQGSGKEVQKTVTAAAAGRTTDKQDDKHKHDASVCHPISSDSFKIKDALGGARGEGSSSSKLEKEDEGKSANSALNSPKIDKFGRLVRQGASDSDSDDSHYNKRHRQRGRSRSRSPRDRWRRSPLRRREKRSRSRSWSPRNQRSRSRSPRSRRNRSRSPRKQRSRSRSPGIRRVGDLGGDNTRRNRVQIPDCFDFRRGRCYRGASCRYLHHDFDKNDGSRSHKSKQRYSESTPVSKDSNIREVKYNSHKESDQQHGEDFVNTSRKSGRFKDGTSDESRSVKSESSREVVAKVLETQVYPEATEAPATVADNSKSPSVGSQDVRPKEDPVTKHSGLSLSGPLLQDTGRLPLHTDDSSISDSAPKAAAMGSDNKFSATDALSETTVFRNHSPQLPPPPPPLPFPHGVTSQPMTQPLIPQIAGPPIPSTSGERFPSYMLPSQQSHFSVSPISSWSLPPRPPGSLSQLQQPHLHPRNDFGSQMICRPYAAELPSHSQVADFQQLAHPPMQDHLVKHLPSYNPPSQQFACPSISREEHSMQHPMTGLNASSSGSHPYLQQQQPHYVKHQSVAMSFSSRYTPDFQEANQSSHLSDFRGPRNSSYYNPYASTFEQPLSSRFSSDVIQPIDRQGIGSMGSAMETLSPKSGRAAAGQNFIGSGGDRYDPLFDSIEPSSNPIKTLNGVQTWEPSSESGINIMLKHSGSDKPMDVEENNKKEVGSVVLGASAENEECGETADAEVGAVENGSPSNPGSGEDMSGGDIEIDQIKSPGKSKKSKESRSMKLFKVALADFVKELLKPSWRQGNMSKEAFKTIVKKTVDKVSGSMKNHHIPKSRAKIDHYIDTQQRKLTKLVMGYVDRYVKA